MPVLTAKKTTEVTPKQSVNIPLDFQLAWIPTRCSKIKVFLSKHPDNDLAGVIPLVDDLVKHPGVRVLDSEAHPY